MKAQYAIIAVILALLPMAARAQDEVKVAGRVVDAAGKPVAGVDVASIWMAEHDGMKPYQGVTTNAEGRFVLPIAFRGRKHGLMALHKDRRIGGLVLMDERVAEKPAEIKLVPLVHVYGRVFCKELNKPPAWINVFVFCDSCYLLRWSSSDAAYSFRIPPGDYRLRTSAPDCQAVETAISLKADSRDVEIKTMEVPASIIVRHKGKTPPAWHVTDARGVTKDVKLSDFKGKWVLLEFWGYW
jgi:hypothetical protein